VAFVVPWLRAVLKSPFQYFFRNAEKYTEHKGQSVCNAYLGAAKQFAVRSNQAAGQILRTTPVLQCQPKKRTHTTISTSRWGNHLRSAQSRPTPWMISAQIYPERIVGVCVWWQWAHIFMQSSCVWFLKQMRRLFISPTSARGGPGVDTLQPAGRPRPHHRHWQAQGRPPLLCPFGDFLPTDQIFACCYFLWGSGWCPWQWVIGRGVTGVFVIPPQLFSIWTSTGLEGTFGEHPSTSGVCEDKVEGYDDFPARHQTGLIGTFHAYFGRSRKGGERYQIRIRNGDAILGFGTPDIIYSFARLRPKRQLWAMVGCAVSFVPFWNLAFLESSDQEMGMPEWRLVCHSLCSKASAIFRAQNIIL